MADPKHFIDMKGAIKTKARLAIICLPTGKKYDGYAVAEVIYENAYA